MISSSAPLKHSLKGILIYPPNQLMDVETPRPDGSLGPLYLAAELERRGIHTDILDASVGGQGQSLEDTFSHLVRQSNGLTRIGMEFKDIAEYVTRGGYDFVGIHSNFTPQTRMVLETAKAIKECNPTIRIYTGGVNARALKERFLNTGYFDGICLSEGELIFPRMVEAHARGESLQGVPGVAFRDNGSIRVNPVDGSCFPKSLDDLPMPAWEKLPFEKYERIASPHGVDYERKGNRYAPIMTSRGCPFKCSYCHISEEKRPTSLTGAIGELRTHSIDRVVAEIDRLKSLGVERLFFEDDSLLADRERTKEIFRRVTDRHLQISNVNGVNLIHLYDRSRRNEYGAWPIDDDYLHILREAGFDQMVFPVESGSERIIKKYATNKVLLDRMDLCKLMRAMTDIGIKTPVNMMIGFPDETEEEIGQSIDFAKRLMDSGAIYVTFFIPIPFPGSRLYDIAISGGHLQHDFDPDIMNWKRPVMRNTVVPPERLEEIRDKANENINTELHLKRRLEQSTGYRWRSH